MRVRLCVYVKGGARERKRGKERKRSVTKALVSILESRVMPHHLKHTISPPSLPLPLFSSISLPSILSPCLSSLYLSLALSLLSGSLFLSPFLFPALFNPYLFHTSSLTHTLIHTNFNSNSDVVLHCGPNHLLESLHFMRNTIKFFQTVSNLYFGPKDQEGFTVNIQ